MQKIINSLKTLQARNLKLNEEALIREIMREARVSNRTAKDYIEQARNALSEPENAKNSHSQMIQEKLC